MEKLKRKYVRVEIERRVEPTPFKYSKDDGTEGTGGAELPPVVFICRASSEYSSFVRVPMEFVKNALNSSEKELIRYVQDKFREQVYDEFIDILQRQSALAKLAMQYRNVQDFNQFDKTLDKLVRDTEETLASYEKFEDEDENHGA